MTRSLFAFGSARSESKPYRFNDGLEGRIFTQRVEIVIFEDSVVRPAAVEGAAERRKGSGGGSSTFDFDTFSFSVSIWYSF